MDETKIAEARQMLLQVAQELTSAADAARGAVSAEREHAWPQVQLLFTRFSAAEQLLKDVRRTVDAAYGEG
jgi:hypothetical protein